MGQHANEYLTPRVQVSQGHEREYSEYGRRSCDRRPECSTAACGVLQAIQHFSTLGLAASLVSTAPLAPSQHAGSLKIASFSAYYLARLFPCRYVTKLLPAEALSIAAE